ncbi:MAG: hypothetical protein ACOX7C_06870 [Brevefilum sp.]|jgi:hypothetical protein
MPFQITREWIIDIPTEFEHRVEEEKLIFWKAGTTVIAAVFSLPNNTGKIELFTQIKEKFPEDILETFVSTRGEIVGLGYTHVLETDEHNRLALVTFTASDTTCLQVGYYLDNPDDLSWAKSVWETIVFIPDGQTSRVE